MPYPITCAACGKTFSITDDLYERKIVGHVVTIKCKQCQANIRVDGTQAKTGKAADPEKPAEAPAAETAAAPAPETPAAPAPAAETAQPAPAPVAATTPAAEAPAAPPPAKLAEAPKPEAPKPEDPPKPEPAKPAEAAKPAETPKLEETPKPASPKLEETPKPAEAAKPADVAKPQTAKAPDATKPLAAKPSAFGAARAPLGSKPTLGGLSPKQPLVVSTPAKDASKPAGLAKAPFPQTKLTRPDATKPASPLAAKTAPTTAPAPSPPAPAAEEPAASEELWAVDYADGQDRELTDQQIAAELKAGVVTASTLVWRDGMDEWKELAEVPELAKLLAKEEPPAKAAAPVEPVPPPRKPAPSAPQLTPQVAVRPARPPAPSSPGLPAPRAPAPSAPAVDLFAENVAPAAAPTATPAAAPPPPPPPEPPPRAPAPSRPVLAGNAFEAPVFPSQPLVQAAQFPPAAPQLVAPAMVPMAIGSTVDEWPAQPKKRTPLIIGLVVVVLGGIGAAVALSGSKAPPPPAIAALPPSVPSTAHTADPNQVPGTATPGQPAEGLPGNPDGHPATTPNAGFAELFASGARHADEKRGVTGPTQRFDPNVAKAAITSAAQSINVCREKGGPTGKATVVVTFEPDGRVSAATVSDPPFAGTATGNCIAQAMKRASVPPFSGLPGTISKSFAIQ